MSLILPPDLSGPSAVYWVRAAGDLLYIGVTKNVEKRLAQHAKLSPWWPAPWEVGYTAEWFANRSDAELAERIAIFWEHPRHNRRRDRFRTVGDRLVDLATCPRPSPLVPA
jgi:hypothetical protein